MEIGWKLLSIQARRQSPIIQRYLTLSTLCRRNRARLPIGKRSKHNSGRIASHGINNAAGIRRRRCGCQYCHLHGGKHPLYSPILRPLWESASSGTVSIVISEQILLETLVGPYRAGLSQLAADYETFLSFPGIRLVPISAGILRAAAEMRAKVTKLRSPDAIHAATAIHQTASCFLTNDLGFRNIPGFNVILLDEVLKTHP